MMNPYKFGFQGHSIGSTGRLLALLLVSLFSGHSGLRAQTAPAAGADGEHASHFGGPSSAAAQLKHDLQPSGPLISSGDWDRKFQPYPDFKEKLRRQTGLSYGVDYNTIFQTATDSLGEDVAAGGVIRLYGKWELPGGGQARSGNLNFKIENRHRLGTDVSPQDFGGQLGYPGLTAVPFSDANTILTNFFWHQKMFNDRLAFVAGIVDVTDYVDIYGLVNPWTDFNNLAFSNNPTISAPNQGMGVAVRGFVTPTVYVLGGIADANGDPSDPWASVESFFQEGKFFKHLEVGWSPSAERRFEDNIHLTAWQVDDRDKAGVDGGWGMAASASYLIDDRWLPFVRAGWSDGGGGALMESAVSVGTGCYLRGKSDMFGVGLHWGRPSGKTFGPGLRDQYAIELFYRLQLFEHLTITPDIQVIVNPAQNPETDLIGVFGLRARVVF